MEQNDYTLKMAKALTLAAKHGNMLAEAGITRMYKFHAWSFDRLMAAANTIQEALSEVIEKYLAFEDEESLDRIHEGLGQFWEGARRLTDRVKTTRVGNTTIRG